jgi:multiple sugar transport system permease protein
VASFGLSFFRWKMIAPPRFLGLDHYITMFTTDVLFQTAVWVTFKYVLIAIPLAQVLALLLALLLNQQIRLLGVWRTVFYLPAVVSGVAGSVIWLWMYHGELGIINNLLRTVGLEGQNWLFDKSMALNALIIKSLWNVGVPMVIYVAALQGLPQMLYEAADIDGAGEWAKFRSITLPMISPAIFFNVVIGIITGVQTFAEPYVMTGGGPDNSTLFLGLHLYQSAFNYLKMGYASAMAWIMFLLILSLTVVQFRLAGRWVYYEGEGR